MIGHYLLSLTPEQEERILTTMLAAAPCGAVNPNGTRCLLGVCYDLGGPDELSAEWHALTRSRSDRRLLHIGVMFDNLCWRFGEPRINAAIRNRILANQARRALLRPYAPRAMQRA